MVFQRRDKYSVFAAIQIIILGEFPAHREKLHSPAAGKEDKRRDAEDAETRKVF
jgi:hypothetical protein